MTQGILHHLIQYLAAKRSGHGATAARHLRWLRAHIGLMGAE